jgi:hypothetical protein
VLQELARSNPAFLQESYWLSALLSLRTEASAMALLDHLSDIGIPDGQWLRICRSLEAWARMYPAVRAALVERYRTCPDGVARSIIESVMGELADEGVFMELFEAHVSARQPFDRLASAIRQLAIGSRPMEDSSGWYEECSVPLTGLRAKLFAMLPAKDERAQLAEKCLIAIEEHRDEHGRIANEPRHPDISTGRPWPCTVGQNCLN